MLFDFGCSEKWWTSETLNTTLGARRWLNDSHSQTATQPLWSSDGIPFSATHVEWPPGKGTTVGIGPFVHPKITISIRQTTSLPHAASSASEPELRAPRSRSLPPGHPSSAQSLRKRLRASHPGRLWGGLIRERCPSATHSPRRPLPAAVTASDHWALAGSQAPIRSCPGVLTGCAASCVAWSAASALIGEASPFVPPQNRNLLCMPKPIFIFPDDPLPAPVDTLLLSLPQCHPLPVALPLTQAAPRHRHSPKHLPSRHSLLFPRSPVHGSPYVRALSSSATRPPRTHSPEWRFHCPRGSGLSWL